MQDHAQIFDQGGAGGRRDIAEMDALLDRMLARRRELTRTVPGVVDFAAVSSDPDLEELRTLRSVRKGS